MSGFFGGDTAQMRQHATTCIGGAQRLAELIEAATATIGSVTWAGPDAEAFRERWQGGPQSDGRSLEERLRDLAAQLEAHAEEQDETSGIDGGGLLGLLGDLLGDLPAFPVPIPGLPFTPSVVQGLGEALSAGIGAPGTPSFYGDEGYGVGNAAADDRPVGHLDEGGSQWDGREIENDLGYVDGYANTRASAGGSMTTDAYGSTTFSGGARAGAEIGVDEMLHLPGGASYQTDARLGAEAYAEGGLTAGPDGASLGVGAGAGAYGDIQGTLNGPDGASGTIGASGYAGAEAHLNSYAHSTRNAEGDVNGISFGSDIGAFAGAKADLDAGATAPGGWLSGSGSFGVEAGLGAGAGYGGTVSTDEFGFAIGGDVAAMVGINGSVGLSIHPNEIVNDILPGDYDLDDAIGDARGAFDSASSAVGDAVSSLNPFD